MHLMESLEFVYKCYSSVPNSIWPLVSGHRTISTMCYHGHITCMRLNNQETMQLHETMDQLNNACNKLDIEGISRNSQGFGWILNIFLSLQIKYIERCRFVYLPDLLKPSSLLYWNSCKAFQYCLFSVLIL